MAEEIVFGINIQTGKAISSFGELKKQTKELRKELDGTKIGTQRFDQLRGSIAQNQTKIRDFNRELRNGKSLGQTFGDSLKKSFLQVGAVIAGAFAVDKLVTFGKEALDLALKAEGIERAFDRLNNPNLLDGLREATKGTVSDLELMQAAVKAENFNIPLDNLASLLEFAGRKARDTGQDVDFLVESLITGIGRKSLPILDNLQLDITEIREETKKLGGDFQGAVGNIVNRQLAEMGENVETTADKIDRLSAMTENLKLTVGELIVEGIDFWIERFDAWSEAIDTVIMNFENMEELQVRALDMELKKLDSTIKDFDSNDQFEDKLDSITSRIKAVTQEINKGEGDVDALREQQEKLFEILDLVNTEYEKFKSNQDKSSGSTRVLKTTLNGLNSELELLKKQLKDIDVNSDQFVATQQRISAVQKEIEDATENRIKKEERNEELQLEKIKSIDVEKVESNQKANDEILNADEQLARNQEKRRELDRQKRIEQEQAFIDASLEIAQIGSDAAFEILNTNLDRRTQRQIESLEMMLEQGTISQEQFDQRSQAIEEDAFQRGKRLASIEVIIEGALAIARTIRQLGGVGAITPPGAALLATTAAATAAQLAVIQSQSFALGGKIEEFADGGMVHGPSHAQGGVKFATGGRVVELEGGEAVINKRSTAMFGPQLSAMNVAGGGKAFFQNGGITPQITGGSDISGIVSAISRLQVNAQVSVEEIRRVQNKVTAIETQSRL